MKSLFGVFKMVCEFVIAIVVDGAAIACEIVPFDCVHTSATQTASVTHVVGDILVATYAFTDAFEHISVISAFGLATTSEHNRDSTNAVGQISAQSREITEVVGKVAASAMV